jgi:hypothetical protein
VQAIKQSRDCFRKSKDSQKLSSIAHSSQLAQLLMGGRRDLLRSIWNGYVSTWNIDSIDIFAILDEVCRVQLIQAPYDNDHLHRGRMFGLTCDVTISLVRDLFYLLRSQPRICNATFDAHYVVGDIFLSTDA